MIFIKNKYTTWYNSIIENAKSRIIANDVYVEKHHIIPRSLGGTDDKENLVVLTAKEHFVCHLLLTKMVKGKFRKKMIYAAWGMANRRCSYQQRYKVTGRIYQSLREEVAKALSIENTGKPSKNKGRELSPEWKEKLRQANLGKKRSQESIEKQRKTITGRKRTFTDEWRANIAKAKQNTPDEVKEKLRQARLGRTYIINEQKRQCKCVKNYELQDYLDTGWKLGRKRFL